jgi:intracellular septation protein
MPILMKYLTEFAPLLVFFIAYKYYNDDIMIATKYLMGFSILSMGISYIYTRKIPKPLLYSTLILLVLGSITLITKDITFIKMKPTIIYIIFAAALFGGIYFNKIFLKSLLGQQFPLQDGAWIILSKRFGYFFIFLALLNEVIWRNLSESIWIKFKVFGIIPILIIFIVSQSSFFNKHKIEESEKNQ